MHAIRPLLQSNVCQDNYVDLDLNIVIYVFSDTFKYIVIKPVAKTQTDPKSAATFSHAGSRCVIYRLHTQHVCGLKWDYLLTLILCPYKKMKKNLKFDRNLGTHQRVLSESFPMNNNMTGFR